MENAHKRRKQPELVRRALIDQAAKLAVEQGLGAVTVQSVSDAVGVTKGGFMHHFPTKQALVDAVFRDLLDALDGELDGMIADDPDPYGSFTRAYVEAVFEVGWEGKFSPWAPLSVLMLTDAGLRDMWGAWFKARVERHATTDGDAKLLVVRLAADGVWLADLGKVDVPDRARLRQRLLDATGRQAVGV